MKLINYTSIKNQWVSAFKIKEFKNRLAIAFVLLVIVLLMLPFFFREIEKRNGVVLNDIFLEILPAIDVSVFIFLIIWTVTVLMIIRAIQNPNIFITLLTSFTLLTCSRIITINCIVLNPPAGLIALKDPLSNFFYGNTFITKDLFYSGHTATMFLMYLCLQNKLERLIALFASIIIGILVLVQHVHYSIDVIAAPFFGFIIFKATKILLKKVYFF